MDEILNITPSTDAASLPKGLQPPTEIVNLPVDEVEIELRSSNVEMNSTLLVPDEAYDELTEIALSPGNANVIIVDDEVRICNMKPSSDPDKDFTIVQAFAAAGQDLSAAPPSRVDLREDWWAVKDQGSTGACAGFSSSSLVEYCFTKTKRIKAGETVSPRPIWMAAKETDKFIDYPTTFIEQEGTSLNAVLNFLQRYGCVRESVMPFSSLYSHTVQQFYAQSAALRIASYYNVGKTQAAWKQWISKYGPLYVAINVDSSWMDASKTFGALSQYNTSQIYGGHAVLICGYDSDKDYFIFKNSWGSTWGDGGYAYASSKWCAQAVLEVYGVSV
jgi:C1A family cysteine protease